MRKQEVKRPSDAWLDELSKRGESNAQICKAIGVKIEVRIVLNSNSDWTYVDEVLDKCREHGAAQVVDQILFDS